MRFYIIVLILLVIYVYTSFYIRHYSSKLYYYRFHKDLSITNKSSTLIEPFNTIFHRYDIHESNSYKKANIIFFNLLTDYIFLFPKILSIQTSLYIYGLKSIDILANKALLYTILSQNKQLANRFTPITYVLDNPKQFNKFLNEFDDSKLYILKKNLQRQKGCTITNNLEYIKDSLENEYVVGQELLQNPFLINKHKINLRQYLVIIVKKKMKCMLYNDGFMYYTPKRFVKDSLDKDRHITTGYIDREIYEMNPLTVKDFYKYLGKHNANILKNNLKELFHFVSESYKSYILKHDSNHHLNFIILGCDVAVDNKLGCKIMEINKGPDLSYKDEKDKQVKYNLVKNTLNEIGLIKSPNNNFINLD